MPRDALQVGEQRMLELRVEPMAERRALTVDAETIGVLEERRRDQAPTEAGSVPCLSVEQPLRQDAHAADVGVAERQRLGIESMKASADERRDFVGRLDVDDQIAGAVVPRRHPRIADELLRAQDALGLGASPLRARAALV